jgi:hypothetical protein
MAIEILGSGQPDGTAVVKSTAEKINLYGGTAVSQHATIADCGTSITAVSDCNANFVKINTLLAALESLGVLASA